MTGFAASLRRTAGALVSAVVNARSRSQWITRLTQGGAVHQDAAVTRMDRYPLLFGAVRDALCDRTHSILSFGCSSGEEVVSLRGYFPTARITGAEINKAMLARCRALPADPGTSFIHSTRDGIAAHGPYDAIFCMAVLQRRPHWVESSGLADLSRHYPFARFAEEIMFLTSQLAPGGLLVVEHSQYRVEDVAEAGLEPVPGVGVAPAKGPRFDRDGRLIDPQPVIARIFRRVSAS